MEFYRQFCQVLGVEAKGGKPGMFDAIQNQIFHLYKEKRQPLLLAVDEAQYLSTAILNDIKMLMNYRYDSVNCFTLILCGEPYLNNTLRKPVHEALRQRITVHYTFSGLSDAEVADYVRHKLVCAGGAETIIDPAALSALHSHSQSFADFFYLIYTHRRFPSLDPSQIPTAYIAYFRRGFQGQLLLFPIVPHVLPKVLS